MSNQWRLMTQRAMVLWLGLTAAFLYCLLLPLWEGWDEPYHYGIVQWVGIDRSLPDTSRAVLSDEVQQSILLAPASPGIKLRHPEVMSFGDFHRLPLSEQRRLRRALEDLSPELQYRSTTGIVNYEAQQAPLTYLLLAVPDRLLSGLPLMQRVLLLRLLIALLTVFITARGILRLGEVVQVPEPYLLAGLVFVLLTQSFLATVCRISNDWLAVALTPWVFVDAIALLRAPSTRVALRLGALLAAGLLSKAYFLAFAGPVIAVAGIAWLRRGLPASRLAALAIPLLAAAPWYARNIFRYGTLSGYGAGIWKRTPGVILPAMAQIPWLTDLPRFGRQALWGGNNSGSVFSSATLNFALALLSAAAVLAIWRLRRSANREALLVVLAGAGAYMAALAYSIGDHYVITKGAIHALMPWYCPPVFPLLAVVLFWGLSRFHAAGRWICVTLLSVWAYVFAATWFVKLLPIYAGYPHGSSRLRLLRAWYFSSWRDAYAMLDSTALGPAWLVILLSCVVAAGGFALCGVIGFRIAGSTPGSGVHSSPK